MKEKYEIHSICQSPATDSIDYIQNYLSEGKNINELDKNGNTALFYAVLSQSEALVQFLLKNGAHPNLSSSQSYPPICAAASIGAKNILSILLRQPDINVNEYQLYNKTALFFASARGDVDMVKQLILSGAKPLDALINGSNSSLLFIPLNEKDYDVVNVLIQHFPELLNRPTRKIYLPLYHAVVLGDLPMVELLIANKADINRPIAAEETALWGAAAFGMTDIVKVLLAHGAEHEKVGIRNHGFLISPVNVAGLKGHIDIVALLLEKPHTVESLRVALHYSSTPLVMSKIPEERNRIQMCSELIKKELMKHLRPGGLTLNDHSLISWQNSFKQLFLKEPSVNDDSTRKDKDSAIRFALVSMHQLLRDPKACIPYLQFLSKELSRQWQKEHSGEDFPKFDSNMMTTWQNQEGLLWPIPNGQFRGLKKYGLLERILLDTFNQNGMGEECAKWSGYVPREISKEALSRNAFFTECRLDINGLFHGNMHNIQRVILLYAMEAGAIPLTYLQEDGVMKQLEPKEVFSALMRTELSFSKAKKSFWMPILDSGPNHSVSFTLPDCLHSMLLTNTAFAGALQDYLRFSFCAHFIKMRGLYNHVYGMSHTDISICDDLWNVYSRLFGSNFHKFAILMDEKKQMEQIPTIETTTNDLRAWKIKPKSYKPLTEKAACYGSVSTLAAALKCLPAGKLQDTPDFNKDVFENIIKPADLRSDNPSRQPDRFFENAQMTNALEIKFQQEWLARITKETEQHCHYLQSIGLADRASYFKVRTFTYQDSSKMPDIKRFTQRMDIPDIVSSFSTDEKHTLFAHSGSHEKEQIEKEIHKLLDIRLYPTIRRLIIEQGACILLGSKIELQSYTKSIKEKIILEIEVPSSVRFFIAINNSGNIKVYISNFVSHENVVQQLITLKLAGVELNKIPILGNTQHFKVVCQEDLAAFEKQASSYLAKKNVLIVAGCSLEKSVCSTLDQYFDGKVTTNAFSGSLVSLTYVQSHKAPNLGFIVLNLNYGELCEEQISIILEKLNCIGIFSGSAAGYINKESQAALPEIGTRVSVHSAKHHSGETVTINGKSSGLHLHVPTIFVETFSWLQNARLSGAGTVDVETFYILSAVYKYQQSNPQTKLLIDIGVFISDYVGIKPLRSYDKVFSNYPIVLQNFIDQALIADMSNPYNNNRLSTPTFSNSYCTLSPKRGLVEENFKKEAVIDSIGKKWDKSEFSKRVHTPVTIGRVHNKDAFVSTTVPRCLHLPIKLPGSDIRIPIEYQHLLEILQQIFDFESSINPGWGNLYAYLTIDQGFVPRAKSQRVPGPHVDGIPRDRTNPENQLIDHAYLVTNAIPTMFYTQTFDMSTYDPRAHHFFAIFRALSDESRTITVAPFEIALMNAYSVHTPTETQHDVNRTFIRLEFSVLEFDRLGNSVNPHFSADSNYPNYPFKYIPRPIPSHLFVPPDVYLKKPITSNDFSCESINHFGRAQLKAFFKQDERYQQKHSAYKDLDLIAQEIMVETNYGLVFSHQGVPQAFCLYKIEDKRISLDTLYTLMTGKGQEILIYAMKILQQSADRLSIQAGLEEGAQPITIVVTENNHAMVPIFLRAARLAKIEVAINSLPKSGDQDLNLCERRAYYLNLTKNTL